MKKILLTLVGLSALMSIHAQVVQIYKNGKLENSYKNDASNKYEVVFTQDETDNHESIVIGGRKWAKMNVGATTVAESPETAYGDYYTWGETDTYYSSLDGATINFKDYATGPGTYLQKKKSYYNFESYCGQLTFKEWENPPYSNGVLDKAYDVAHVKWGGDWRMPTKEDFEALHAACGGDIKLKDAPETGNITQAGVYWVKAGSTVDGEPYGVAGALFVPTAAPANPKMRLFLPMAGNLQYQKRDGAGTLCTYWSSSFDGNNPSCAENLSVSTAKMFVNFAHQGLKRCFGLSIRPVAD